MSYAALTTRPDKSAAPSGRGTASSARSVFAATAACLQRKAAGSGGPAPAPAYAPSIVHEVLRTDGQQLDPGVRDHFASRFQHDFTRIRIHTGERAEQSAAAVNARAYTVGQDIVFGRGEYQPQAHSGHELLSHELTHAMQQQHVADSSSAKLPIDSPTSPMERAAEGGSQLASHAQQTSALVSRTPLLQRFPTSYAEAKEEVYKGIIYAARKANQASIALLRSAAAHLPDSVRGYADSMITIDDVVIGALIAVVLAVIGIVVGFGEGIVDLIKGLATMIYGVSKLLFDIIMDSITMGDRTSRDLQAVWQALKGLPDAVAKLVKDWLDQFEKASSERQSLMIGELTGQVLALIATYGVAAGRAGTAAKVVSEGSELAGVGGETTRAAAAATDTATTATKAAKPALTVIQGGGGGATRAASAGSRVAAGADRVGSAALKLAPEVAPEVEQAPRFVPRLVPPLPAAAPAAAPVAAAAPSTGKAIAAGVGVAASKATATATKNKPKERPPFVLKLPQEKSPHLGLYRSWLGVLQSDPNYTRGNPAQRDKWMAALRIGGSDAIPHEVYERGHTLGLTGEAGEDRIRIPDWSRTSPSIKMEVDHIVELQLTPSAMRPIFDEMAYYELLDKRSNGSAGPRLAANVVAERAKQVAFDPALATQIIPFDAVEMDGGAQAERWLLDDIRSGAQLDAYKGGK